MQIIPAIDIRNGKCVRLTQGDFAKEKIYSDDPVTVAKQWKKEGATMIHVVDLDGAKNGAPENIAVIRQLVSAVTIPVQVGGGIRNIETVEQLLNAGVTKVILGTIVLEDKDETKKILQSFPTRIVIALDAKNGKLMKKGWLEESEQEVLETIKKLEEMGAKEFIYTDVVRDGSLTEPNYEEIKKILDNTSLPIIVGGGIASKNQIEKLAKLGAAGVILGKALYEKRINFKEVQL